MNYREALAWLFGTQLFGIKLGLENIQRLLRALELPAAGQRILHVAGTNGKGSVCAMLDAILRAAGHRTGRFTSPHLVTFRERIQVDGEMIAETEVARGLTRIRALVAEWDPHPTFFEIATALGLLHFAERACAFAVLETGMGGRLDATNAVTPIVSVLTPIALDHQKWLGSTLREIAREKAGIIKPGIPVVSAPQLPEAAAVIRQTAAERGAPLTFVRGALDSSLPGKHQRENAALAAAALSAAEIAIDLPTLGRGLANVAWPARFQRFAARTVIDGAHNPAGARVLAQTWREEFPGEQAALILGVFTDKDAAAIFRELAGITAAIFLPQFRGPRALPPAALARIVAEISPEIPSTLADSTGAAIDLASKMARPVLIAGSLHLAGEALAHLRGEPAAFEECTQ